MEYYTEGYTRSSLLREVLLWRTSYRNDRLASNLLHGPVLVSGSDLSGLQCFTRSVTAI